MIIGSKLKLFYSKYYSSIKIIFYFGLVLFFLLPHQVDASWYDDLGWGPFFIKENNPENLVNKIINTFRIALSAVAIAFIIFSGVRWVTAIGNPEVISRQRKNIMYTAVGMIIMNLTELAKIFDPVNVYTNGSPFIYDSCVAVNLKPAAEGVFFHSQAFECFLENKIFWPVELFIGTLAIFYIVIAAARIIVTFGKAEDTAKSQLSNLTAVVIGLILIALAKTIRYVAFFGDVRLGNNLIGQVTNLVFFFVTPITFFFLIVAGFYMITDMGTGTRVKKGQKIIINTLIALVIMLSAYVIVKEILGDSVSVFTNENIPHGT